MGTLDKGKDKESTLFSKQEVGDDIGVCALNLQIVLEKSKLLKHVIKVSFDLWKEASPCK